MAKSRIWRPQMTRQEFCRGWVFFALYFLIFPVLMGTLQWVFDEKWGFYLSDAGYGVLYYVFSVAMVLLVFWSFLRHGVDLLLDWLPENLFALITGFAVAGVLHLLVDFLPYPVENPLLVSWVEQYQAAPAATTLIVVALMPFVEEVLFRGLLFGGLRRYGRPAAYGMTVVLYALYNVYQFVLITGDTRYLLTALQFLPMSLALTWCYDNGGSIWSPVVLHMLLNGITLWTLPR